MRKALRILTYPTFSQTHRHDGKPDLQDAPSFLYTWATKTNRRLKPL